MGWRGSKIIPRSDDDGSTTVEERGAENEFELSMVVEDEVLFQAGGGGAGVGALPL